MTQAQDAHFITIHAIAKYVRRDDRHFPPPVTGIAPAMRKFGQAFSKVEQALRQSHRRQLIECGNICDDGFEVFDCLVGPDDPSHLVADFGTRQALAGNLVQGIQRVN